MCCGALWRNTGHNLQLSDWGLFQKEGFLKLGVRAQAQGCQTLKPLFGKIRDFGFGTGVQSWFHELLLRVALVQEI